jgi:uncharacterized protein (DUF2249 family)
MRAETVRPVALEGLDPERRVDLDVREDLRRGHEPLARIMDTVTALGPSEVLVLRTSFEPVPLYRVLGRRGFARWTEQHDADDWSTWFYPELVVLDVRGLEPPEPMARVLKALDRLAPGQRLEVRHDRRPMLPYPLLDDGSFAHDTDEPEPGLVRIVIRPRSEATG